MLINTAGPLKKNTETEVVSSSFKTQPKHSVLSKLYGLDVYDSIEPTMTLDSVTLAPVPEATDTYIQSLALTAINLTTSQFHNLQINDGDTFTSSFALTAVELIANQYHDLQIDQNDTVTHSLALTSIMKDEILVRHHQHAVDTITRSLTLTSITKS